MFGEDRLKFLCKSIHLVIGLSRKEIEEDGRNIIQKIVIAIIILGINYGVIERRRLWIINEFLYMLIITTDTFHEGFLVMLHLYKVERWSLMWGCIFFKKWINHNYYFTIYYLQFCSQQLQHRYFYNSTSDYQQLFFLKAVKGFRHL